MAKRAVKKKTAAVDRVDELGLPDDDVAVDGSTENTEGTEKGDASDTTPDVENPEYRAGVKVSIPLGRIKDGDYVRRQLSTRLNAAQGEALARMVAGLDAARARTQDGRQVTNGAEAIRWLLEQVGGE